MIVERLVAPGKTLPDKLSDLMELALTDAGKLNRERYAMDSDVLHQSAQKRGDRKCGVSLPGAVMARTLKVQWRATCEWESVVKGGERRLYEKLDAIESARMGRIGDALLALEGRLSADFLSIEQRANWARFNASLTAEQEALLDKWEESEFNVWPYGPQDWDCFDDTLPDYKRMIAEMRVVGW